MLGHRGAQFLAREVRFRDIRLGVAVDLLLDAGGRRVIGVDVRCGDGAHRFLPLAVSDVSDGHLAVGSPLSLVSGALGFYDKRARPLSSLRGRPVRRRGLELGRLADVVFGDDGAVAALEVETPAGRHELPFEDGVAVDDALRPAV
jgi:hypothetical protein